MITVFYITSFRRGCPPLNAGVEKFHVGGSSVTEERGFFHIALNIAFFMAVFFRILIQLSKPKSMSESACNALLISLSCDLDSHLTERTSAYDTI